MILFLCSLCLFLGSRGVARAASERLPEYQVKAAFVYGIAKFVDWPDPRAIPANGTVIIGVLGRNPFGNYLADLTNSATVRVPIPEVRHVTSVREAQDCHILFISESEKDHLPELLQSLRDHPILTVSDTDRFGERGGMINLVLIRQSVKLEVNLVEARRAGLKISSKLLAMARLVETSPTSSNVPTPAPIPGREE